MTYDELNIGDCHEELRNVSAEDVDTFARLSGDKNPLHIDEAFAAKTLFKKRVAHGMLLGSYISAILGMKFPGSGTIYMQQSLKFLRPVFVGDDVKICITVAEKRPEKKHIVLNTEVIVGDGNVAVSGTAMVKLEK